MEVCKFHCIKFYLFNQHFNDYNTLFCIIYNFYTYGVNFVVEILSTACKWLSLKKVLNEFLLQYNIENVRKCTLIHK